ncbi:alkylated DNA repair protein (DNA oxidative demethylase) [Rhodobium orientis]|uniref:Alkylated DNA repair dioxygenase n=1 Tax=Rhodobium orientis TaxID=34017 RepID=A0A327JG49_9HYPH|nr:alpha-ketoglutarate-dependent dioxygenase AlkB [Rhodobium orientis]MBB4304488.1 alkylated DNA repair protein (DNA oxidative demethylase) [Rhodobium orientis]MBK5948079.1 alkylated DNA repair dioxygenase [Rhodobium orientis]RAI25377.1 alkylated DNA repair dioxygenase [Rhodobium orientis]
MQVKPGYLSPADQADLLSEIATVISAAPFFTPRMPRTGKPFSVAMTNCGPLGWVSDRAGYRYQPRHPETDAPWPAMPDRLLDLWDALSGYPGPPQACLVNYYGPGTRMGLHTDADEEDFSAPVLSVSLGDTALFRIGGTRRKDPTRSFRVSSGDIVLLTGETRRAYHGIDRLYPGTSRLLAPYGELFPEGGRINLTLRRVTPVSG